MAYLVELLYGITSKKITTLIFLPSAQLLIKCFFIMQIGKNFYKKNDIYGSIFISVTAVLTGFLAMAAYGEGGLIPALSNLFGASL